MVNGFTVPTVESRRHVFLDRNTSARILTAHGCRGGGGRVDIETFPTEPVPDIGRTHRNGRIEPVLDDDVVVVAVGERVRLRPADGRRAEAQREADAGRIRGAGRDAQPGGTLSRERENTCLSNECTHDVCTEPTALPTSPGRKQIL